MCYIKLKFCQFLSANFFIVFVFVLVTHATLLRIYYADDAKAETQE